MQNLIEQFVKKFMYVAILLFAIRCSISWEEITTCFSLYVIASYIGEAVGCAVLVAIAYERQLWRANPFEKIPKLKKQYEGVIKSTYDNAERTVTFEIRQTLLSVRVIMSSDESDSKSVLASIDTVLGEPQLIYCYLNQPKAEHRRRSEIHYGTTTLSLSDVNCLRGQYYTDRGTTGDILLTAKQAIIWFS